MRKKEDGKKVLVIGGPTGIGKSAVAYEVAKKINGEIISADSRQFYREINIGTDKVPMGMRNEVPHHLIDFLSLKDDFDVYGFAKLAHEKIDEIRSRGRIPVLVGGSGLYLRSLVTGIFTVPEGNRERQQEIRRQLEERTTEALYRELLRVDPALEPRIHENDRKRIRRALEVFYQTGKKMSFWQKQKPDTVLNENERQYFILYRNREEMYERIEQRVDKMFEDGWVEEVEQLKKKSYSAHLREKAPIGYVEIMDYLDGMCGKDELKSLIKQKTRNFARKQLTWFLRENGTWLQLSGGGTDAAAEIIKDFI